MNYTKQNSARLNFRMKTRHLIDLIFAATVWATWALFETGQITSDVARLPIIAGAAGIMLTTIWGAAADYTSGRRGSPCSSSAMSAAG